MRMSLIRVLAAGIAASSIALPLTMSSAFAADAPMTSQQRMAMCSAQNKGKKGDDYKKSQSDCLKGQTAAAAPMMTPQQKMAMCSTQNKGRKGDDYKQAQSACLKG